ncbi:S24/S26 family peptidase [Tuwongella immobilis]|uniref:Peptidase S24/S26A/S26B/S26C domain-containing protein n=1 Tax=Tuwongella immobilis TaxID=692036 RepID=A0A6C2YUN2_9BACT|nr:S24/S26 family peptidase [Tuwongella immobilis]VIP04749.1 Uncharacterized protein OS=Ktedonobacter racemifer DSM 44963 GN=Krac_5291 PE=4 SV=1 [Tuwongella immobilis]VTS06857.1 Uncharacterized protein OS=Ktedonobacter racemifer DSM 44963 GN=Krac_5291 PE=4 SV=1 [Tuwongella immobilis]
MDERQWAIVAVDALARGEVVQVRPRGHSMRGRIEDGSRVTLAPCLPDDLAVGDVVLARVRGWLLVLHQIVDIQAGRFQIGTTSGRIDGWVSAADIVGRVIAVEESDESFHEI